MYICKVKKLSKEINGEVLFENVDLEIKQGEHIALFGRNGVGKTTLLKVLAGILPFDSGEIYREVPISSWGWLEQSPVVSETITAKNFVLSEFEEWFSVKSDLEELETKLQHSQDEHIFAQYQSSFEMFLELGGYDRELEADVLLSRLNIDSTIWDVPFHLLSGGQKTKMQLAKILLKAPKFIIMDEPTNHLDQETIDWLENWMNQYTGAILYVSHDRYFLDQTAHAIVDLGQSGSTLYTGGYSNYREQKEIERKTEEKNYQKYKNKKKELQESIRRYQQWFHKAHQAAGQDDFLRSKAKKNISRYKAKESELERLESQGIRKPKDEKKLNITLDSSGFSGKSLLQFHNVTFQYGKKIICKDFNFNLNRQDRVAVIGPNGSGKSTLLRLLMQQLQPNEGSVTINPQTKVGYFDQELDVLNDEETILENLLRLPNMTQTEARTILGSFMFRRDTVHKKVSNLSMGEKCRVALIKLYFSKANLLVLDELTNFLDIETGEHIESVIQSYPGAMMIVTHDRYFAKKVANRILSLHDGEVIDYHGDYDHYLKHIKDKMEEGQLWIQNERETLELKLVELMSKEEETIDLESNLQEIKKLKGRLEELREMEQGKL
ncbi:ribosomal protection-like ABC-F family protein [Salinibacillus xinjiangensis]|uniref:ABC-F type ribosomal protection protein n=1 Tax=Salinibacillus xinjiangensis TaxID=1229268 RepID=A0A6G1X8L3_9BACI|nr:ABC-F type ribosomal protection protein [Salinibacillus xinjiangensis]MRG87282.1 ABC-F type ribosomal protection protein [Salinibacillus xinjiangensis]